MRSYGLPSRQNKMSASYVSANQEYVKFVCFVRIISTFLQYVSYYIKLNFSLGGGVDGGGRHFPSIFNTTFFSSIFVMTKCILSQS